MSDSTEKHGETEDVEADFEGHRFAGPEKLADITDVKAANDDDGADFEGHRFAGPEKLADPNNKLA